MSRYDQHNSGVRSFKRDIFSLTGIFALILFLLWLAGALKPFAALFAGVISVLVGYYFHHRLRILDEASLAARQYSPEDDAGSASEIERLLLQALSQPALLIYDNKIKFGNEAAFKLFHLPANGSDFSVASLRDPKLLTAIEEVVILAGSASCEIQSARNPGEFWRADITPLGNTPNKDGILIVMIDQKPVRLAEQARADFLANASHELRTPLTSIAGFIETMKGAASDDLSSWPRFIEIMDEQTRHMRDLIADLLSLSRIELSEHLLPETSLDLGVAAEETMDALQLIAAARGLTLTMDRPEGALKILGDEGEVKQVIRNLVGNALKYAPDKSRIKVTLGLSSSLVEAQTQAARSWAGAGRLTLLDPVEHSGAAIWLQVRDQGLGIAQDHLPRLGERFYRVDRSRGGPIEGTGLGLAIVKHIMSRHQGGLAVESIYGKGASFAVWFPVYKA